MSSTTLPSAPLYTKDALNQDIADLLAIIPEVEPFTYLVPMRVDPKLDTAAMSQKELIFGEAFMDKLTPAERKGVILHEIWHAALCHATDDYPIEPGDHRLRNMAMDIVINQKIKDYANRGYSIELPTYEGMYNPPLGYRLADAAYEGMSWCEVYEILRLTAPEDCNKVIYATFDEHECSPGEDTAKKGATIVGGQLKRNAKAAMDAHDSIKAGQSPLTSAGTEHGGGMGVSGGTPAMVSWQDKLRDVLISVCVRGGVSWQKIDRRAFAMSHGETYQASRTQYEPSLPKTRILLDTSGSMCDIIGSAIKDIANILRSLNCMNVEILLYDTQVCDTIVLMDNGHVLDDPTDWTAVSGGGGTNVRDALVSLQMTNDLNDLNDLIMVITDGQDELTAFDLAVRPAVWIVYGNNSGDTGVTIHIQEDMLDD